MRSLFVYGSSLILSLGCVTPSWAAMSNAPLTGEAYVLAEQAYQALARHDDASAEQLIVRAREVQPDSYQLAMLLLDTQMRRGEWDSAQKLAEMLLADMPNDALLLADCGYIAQFQHRYLAAREYFEAALRLPGLDSVQRLNVQKGLDSLQSPSVPPQPPAAQPVPQKPVSNVTPVASNYALMADAYRLMNERQYEPALKAFQAAFALQPGTPNQYASAAYAAKNANNRQLAIEFFHQALDADRAMPVSRQPFDAQQVFTYRREIQQLNRNWGATLSLTYQRNAITNTSQLNTLQGGAEIYWQPNDFVGNQNGHLFHVFAGAGQTLYDAHGGRTGSATAQGTLGVRYKPFSSLGMMLVAQQIVPLANTGINDTYLHVGYFDAVGSELNLLQSSWKNWQYYADAGYFVRARRTYGIFEGNYGEAMYFSDLGDRAIVTPHIVLATEYDSATLKPFAASAGPGVKIRYWLREDAYNAPASVVEVSMQYRFELTNSGRSQGMLMRAMYLY